MTAIGFLCVFVGGGLGASLRYFAQSAFNHDALFPWTTLGINIAGSFAIGLVWSAYADADWFIDWGRLFIVLGLLGGFTTFSTFSLEALQLLQQGRIGSAAAYAIASLGTCLIAVYAGFRVMQIN